MRFECDRTCKLFQLCQFQPIFDALGQTRVFSHVAKVDIEIRDLDALAQASEKLGLQLRLGQKKYRWYGHSVGDYPMPEGMSEKDLGKCTHAIHMCESAYEIGVIETSPGKYSLVWDFWNGGYGIQAAVGDSCKTLISEYTIAAARNAAIAQGWMTQEVNGTLQIYLPQTDGGGMITVHSNGTVDADGFVGAGCNVTSAIENALGKVRDLDYKSSYFEEKAHIKVSE